MIENLLTEYNPKICAARNTENLLENWRYHTQSSLVNIIEDDELFQFDCGLTRDKSPFSPQGIWKANLKQNTIHQRIEEVVEYFTSKDMPFLWYVCPSSTPSNLGEILKTHSFNEMDGTPVMAIKLEDLIDDRPKPPNLVIKEAEDESSFRLWWELWVKGYPQPEPLGKLMADVFVDIGYKPDNKTKFYIAYLDGEPAGTSLFVIGGGVVGLYGVTVIPNSRGKGLGTELSLHPLRIAKSMGLHIGVLDATQQGIGIYRRIGFKEVSTPKIYFYSSPENENLGERMKDFMHTPRN